MSSPSDVADSAPLVGLVVPLRSLRAGKNRLAEVLDSDARADLIGWMASTVVAAGHDLPVLVVHDDDDVRPWAVERGASALRPDAPGLNAAASAGRDWFRRRGAQRVIVAHADLPLVRDLRPVGDFDGITIVPDRHGDGTNLLAVPTHLDFAFAYGPGSFDLHYRQAEASDAPVRILDHPSYRYDIDHPDDLAGLEFDLSSITTNAPE